MSCKHERLLRTEFLDGRNEALIGALVNLGLNRIFGEKVAIKTCTIHYHTTTEASSAIVESFRFLGLAKRAYIAPFPALNNGIPSHSRFVTSPTLHHHIPALPTAMVVYSFYVFDRHGKPPPAITSLPSPLPPPPSLSPLPPSLPSSPHPFLLPHHKLTLAPSIMHLQEKMDPNAHLRHPHRKQRTPSPRAERRRRCEIGVWERLQSQEYGEEVGRAGG